MTTASIYYHNASSEPDFIVIDGERAHVHAADYTGEPNITGGRIRAVDHAARRLGWKVVDNAPIVRQADGRGTIRVEPGPELLAAADRAVDASIEQTAAELSGPGTVAYIDTNEAGVPQTVSVDGRTEPVHSSCSLSSSNPANAERAVNAVHVALAAHGYHPTGPMTRRAEGSAVDHMRTQPVESDEQWRDVPTMVRIDDDTSRALNDMAARLGIPGDVLAAEWIRHGAADALRRFELFMSPGYIADHTRITGWQFDGSPRLKGH